MSERVLRIGTRKSQLALIQTNEIKNELEKKGYKVEIAKELNTVGDQILDKPLNELAKNVGDKGLFTHELETSLIDGSIDLAVHSLKDLPTKLDPRLALGCINKRLDPRDVLILRSDLQDQKLSLSQLPKGSIIGTSSLRRVAQLSKQYSSQELVFESIRGNLNTRIKKLDQGPYSGIILAYAGIQRLGWENRISEFLPSNSFMYAVGQGALGIECRSDDEELLNILKSAIEEPITSHCCKSERALLKKLEGGCQLPLGVCCQLEIRSIDGSFKSVTLEEAFEYYSKENQKIYDLYLDLSCCVLSKDGTRSLNGSIHGPLTLAEQLGISLGDQLISKGVKNILD